MTVCCAAKFHPAKPKPGSSGAPILRGAAFIPRGGSARKQNLTTDPTDDTDLHGSDKAGPNRERVRTGARSYPYKAAAEGGCAPQFLKNTDSLAVTAGAAVPHESCTSGSLLFGNDTEGRDGFVKMAEFQLLHRTSSLLILDEEIVYSRPFRRNPKKNEL